MYKFIKNTMQENTNIEINISIFVSMICVLLILLANSGCCDNIVMKQAPSASNIIIPVIKNINKIFPCNFFNLKYEPFQSKILFSKFV